MEPAQLTESLKEWVAVSETLLELVPAATPQQAAVSAGWFLSTDDKWAKPYFDASDLHSVDRRLFA